MRMRRLTITPRGTIHRHDCDYARRGVPWEWADRVPNLEWVDGHPSSGELTGDGILHGATACKLCRPDDGDGAQ